MRQHRTTRFAAHLFVVSSAIWLALPASVALAQQAAPPAPSVHPGSATASSAHGTPSPSADAQHKPANAEPPQHGKGEPGSHASGDHAGHTKGEHGAEGETQHAGHEEPGWDKVNWFYGFVGEQDEKSKEPPGLLWRKKGMPVPFGAYVLNALLLYALLYKLFGKTIADGLVERKRSLMQGMNEAAAIKASSQAKLAALESKLSHVESEIARMTQEARERAEAERERALREAESRRGKLEQDAKALVEQEVKTMRQTLTAQAVHQAVTVAKELLSRQVGPRDHERIQQGYLDEVKKSSRLGGAA